MHAHALEVLAPVIPPEGGRVLDVGCGSGFLTAALSRLVGAGGVVYGMVRRGEKREDEGRPKKKHSHSPGQRNILGVRIGVGVSWSLAALHCFGPLVFFVFCCCLVCSSFLPVFLQGFTMVGFEVDQPAC